MVRVNATGHQREPTASPTGTARYQFSLVTSQTLILSFSVFSLTSYRLTWFLNPGFRISNRNPIFSLKIHVKVKKGESNNLLKLGEVKWSENFSLKIHVKVKKSEKKN